MILLNNLVFNLNFKKAIKNYIIALVLILTVFLVATTYLFREKISFATYYYKTLNTIEKSGINNNINSLLDKLANSSKDIKDVILLSSDNTVVYSSKKSNVSRNNKLTLHYSNIKQKYLVDNNNPHIFYKLVKPERILLSKKSIKKTDDINEEIQNEFFYDKNFNENKVYLLSYIADTTNGMKIFIINDIKAIPHAERILEIMGFILIIFFAIYWLGVALWVYKDASKIKATPIQWALVAIFTNLAGLIIYLIFKQNNSICSNCGTLQSKKNIFCTNCGKKIKKTCDNCNTPLNRNDKYCSKCANKL